MSRPTLVLDGTLTRQALESATGHPVYEVGASPPRPEAVQVPERP